MGYAPLGDPPRNSARPQNHLVRSYMPNKIKNKSHAKAIARANTFAKKQQNGNHLQRQPKQRNRGDPDHTWNELS